MPITPCGGRLRQDSQPAVLTNRISKQHVRMRLVTSIHTATPSDKVSTSRCSWSARLIRPSGVWGIVTIHTYRAGRRERQIPEDIGGIQGLDCPPAISEMRRIRGCFVF